MSDRLPPHKLVDIVVNIAELYFDPNNYRIRDPDGSEAVPDERIREPEVQAATRSVLSRKSLGDLRSSIVHNGFLLIDRVVVRRLAGGGYCIVEGNRRIAAFRSLLDEYAEGLRELPSSLLEHARALQVVVIEAEPSAVAQVAAAVMGIRHVSGPMKWTGFQSAGLVHDMYRSGRSRQVVGIVATWPTSRCARTRSMASVLSPTTTLFFLSS